MIIGHLLPDRPRDTAVGQAELDHRGERGSGCALWQVAVSAVEKTKADSGEGLWWELGALPSREEPASGQRPSLPGRSLPGTGHASRGPRQEHAWRVKG